MSYIKKSPAFRFSLMIATLFTLATGCNDTENRSEQRLSWQSYDVQQSDQPRAAQVISYQSPSSPQQFSKQNRSDISGFYAYLNDRRMRVNADGSMTLSSGPSGLWLNSDGRFAKTAIGLSEGFDSFCRTANSCGQYKVQNGQYTWFYDSDSASDAETESISQGGNQLQFRGATYQYIAPARDMRLSGSYQKVTSSISSSMRVTAFNQNGGFVVASLDEGGRSGTYRIDGYTLTYSFTDGGTETHDFYMLENRPYIDGVRYIPFEYE